MEKEDMTDVELLVDIQNSSCGRQDLANWPNHGAEIDLHAACDSKFGAWIASGSGQRLEIENGPERVCVL